VPTGKREKSVPLRELGTQGEAGTAFNCTGEILLRWIRSRANDAACGSTRPIPSNARVRLLPGAIDFLFARQGGSGAI